LSRKPRKKSDTGMYHIMLRGINQQIIFEDSQDYKYFLKCIRHAKENYSFEIYTYCLMNNHVHLLIAAPNSPLDQIIKSIGTKYVYYFNHKYNRIGHLFQDRFRSETILNTNYLLQVFRYILHNPISAGITNHCSQYMWTNYSAFIGKPDNLTNAKYITSLFPDHDSLLAFLNETRPHQINFMEYSENHYKYIDDSEAHHYIEKISNCKNASEFQSLDKAIRNKYLHQLKETGLTIRQISRLTGISKTVIGRA